MTQIVIDTSRDYHWIDYNGKSFFDRSVSVDSYDLSVASQRSRLAFILRSYEINPPVCYEMFLLGENSRIDVTAEKAFKILHRIWRDRNDKKTL